MLATINTGGNIMFDQQSKYPWNPAAKKAKDQSISQVIQKSREDGSSGSDGVDLRNLLVQRTMLRHGLTEEQAIALISSFGGCGESQGADQAASSLDQV
jgi:hypothetical protein